MAFRRSRGRQLRPVGRKAFGGDGGAQPVEETARGGFEGPNDAVREEAHDHRIAFPEGPRSEGHHAKGRKTLHVRVHACAELVSVRNDLERLASGLQLDKKGFEFILQATQVASSGNGYPPGSPQAACRPGGWQRPLVTVQPRTNAGISFVPIGSHLYPAVVPIFLVDAQVDHGVFAAVVLEQYPLPR